MCTSYKDSQHFAGRSADIAYTAVCSAAVLKAKFKVEKVLTASCCNCPAEAEPLLSSATPVAVCGAAAATAAAEVPGASTWNVR
jgi:hypothetical protein